MYTVLQKNERPFFICRSGEPNSAVHLTREPDANQLAFLEKCGWIVPNYAETYWLDVRCPVNGDGYSVEIRRLRDYGDTIVGHYGTGRYKDLND
jgi:hypothetical protein